MIADANFLEKRKLSMLVKESEELIAIVVTVANKSRRSERAEASKRST